MNDVMRALTRAADAARRESSIHSTQRPAAVPDRRPVPPEPAPVEARAAVTRAVSGAGLRLHVLRTDHVAETPEVRS